jgi:hypothetical protein
MRGVALGLLIILASTPVLAQGDPGAPDSVRVSNAVFAGGQAVVTVTLTNDEPLSGLQIPLQFSTDLAILDSVVFGARTAGFAGDDIVRWDTDLGGSQRTVMLTVVPLASGQVAAGSDAIALLYLSVNGTSTSDTSLINTTTLNPAGGLLLGDTSPNPVGFQPAFVGGSVRSPLAIWDDDGTLPTRFELAQNYPNPFNPETALRLSLPQAGHVTLDIYNLLGQRVITLYDGSAPAGYLELRWNGRDQAGRPVGSGVYFYRMVAGDFQQVRKMVLLK